MKKILSIICAFVIVLSLAGCGSKESLDKYVGKYKGEYTKLVGDTDENKVTDEEFSLELKKDGTGVSNRGGENYDIKWSLDGEKFTMTETFMGISLEYTGTLKDNKINIYNGDPTNDFTVLYVYNKE